MLRATRLLAALALLCGAAVAQDKAVVVATCGTPPHTYTAGQIQPLVQNVDGEVCVTGGGVPTFPLLAPNGSAAAPSYSFTNATGMGMSYTSAAILGLHVGGVRVADVRAEGLYLPTTNPQIFLGISADVVLRRDGAGNLALGTFDAAAPVAQTLSVQDVVAGTSNTAGVATTIQGSRGTGTGAGGSIIFQTAPAGGSGSSQNGLTTAFTIATSGISTSGSVTSTTHLNFGDAGFIQTISRANLSSPADGVWRMSNTALTDFNRLQFGGTTSAFPSLKRNATGIDVRLADDSGYAPLTASTVTATNASIFSGALVRKSVAQTGADYTTATAIAFDAEDYDTTAWHDTVTNNSRHTVPTGVTHARLMCQVSISNGTATTPLIQIQLRKNGATNIAFVQTTSGSASPNLQIVSPPLLVAATDYFECLLTYTVDASIDVGTNSQFSIENAF